MANVLNEKFDVLKQLFNECLNAKNNSVKNEKNLEEKLKNVSLLFVLIKKVNRLDKYKVRSGREELQNQKTSVDCNRLHLQNLLYEVNYLKREIKNCYKFKSQDEDIDIYEANDASLSHGERIARLERELALRKKLSDDCTKLLNEKAKVFDEIIVNMENLSTFAPSLRTLRKATQPLQDALHLQIEQKWKLEHKVHMLPQHLYLCYINLMAVAMDDDCFELNVIGNENEVKSYESKIKSCTPSKEEMDDCFLFEPHPLSIQLKLCVENFANDCVTVNMCFLPHLKVVTAHCHIRLCESLNNEANIIQDYLKYVYDNDLGDTLSSEIELILEKHEVTTNEFYSYLAKTNLGKPYRWLQQICGSSSFNHDKNDNHNAGKIKEFTMDCIKRVKAYWKARYNLITQIKAFTNKNLELFMHKDDMASNMAKPNCSLVQWSSVTWEEYESSPAAATLIANELVDETQSFYRAVIVLSSAKMECLISISNKYPQNAPLWLITVHWNGHHNALNSSSIKLMEHYTNCLSLEEAPTNLLAQQLLRTMYSFDIFLETEGPLYQPLEYNKEKSFIRSFSKRLRVRPYRNVRKGPISYFKQ